MRSTGPESNLTIAGMLLLLAGASSGCGASCPQLAVNTFPPVRAGVKDVACTVEWEKEDRYALRVEVQSICTTIPDLLLVAYDSTNWNRLGGGAVERTLMEGRTEQLDLVVRVPPRRPVSIRTIVATQCRDSNHPVSGSLECIVRGQ